MPAGPRCAMAPAPRASPTPSTAPRAAGRRGIGARYTSSPSTRATPTTIPPTTTATAEPRLNSTHPRAGEPPRQRASPARARHRPPPSSSSGVGLTDERTSVGWTAQAMVPQDIARPTDRRVMPVTRETETARSSTASNASMERPTQTQRTPSTVVTPTAVQSLSRTKPSPAGRTRLMASQSRPSRAITKPSDSHSYTLWPRPSA